MTGNASYIHLSADARVSLHRSDNLFGVLDAREDDVTVELSIATLAQAAVRGKNDEGKSRHFTVNPKVNFSSLPSDVYSR